MSRTSIERKLWKVADQINALRDELVALDHQEASAAEDADDTRVRALVSDAPEAGVEHREAQRALDGVRRDREAKMRRLAKLETKQDALLDKLGSVLR